MNKEIVIRNETEADVSAIAEVTVAAFKTLEIGNQTEYFVIAAHVNDSKKPLGSRGDRHEQIGRGWLGIGTFQGLLADRRLEGIPFILETPKGKKGEPDWDRRNISLLKELRKPHLPPQP